ncbi:uncharacterized protein BT62DRAFT_936055 [Guyanagaster necrorhizus]|uniref:F-box domain-containing protein n=1 Tax=Guyanagaster necrorhizus TaxID=856835 RepID=A0A9P7VJX8_9AGAR|nr:uncharacterized protein BT62DRAFT_936055 [Guyanagaster necrorhizus MCA 3950]KAG7442498.1 hypothetical protein BT62DRAFT_936055 [Guyanagaster necrorhizus MCA 3950]
MLLFSWAIPSYLSNILLRNKNSQLPKVCYIQRLPFDIFVEHVFPLLCIEEILRLRRVNRMFFLLTHEPVIWKRFMARMNIPVPPFRPTFQYALRDTDFEIEQMITRAISVDDNFRRRHPSVASRYRVPVYSQIFELKLVLGGKYLVASVVNHVYRQFQIVIVNLEHPEEDGVRPVLYIPVRARASHLDAKYMTYHGQPGIMVSYVCRSWKKMDDGTPTDHLTDLDDLTYHAPVDEAHPIKYECNCYFSPMLVLESLSDPYVLPGDEEYERRQSGIERPSNRVMAFTSGRVLYDPSLFESDGVPYVVITQQPDRIMVANLHTHTTCLLLCRRAPGHENHRYTIMAVRVLPEQSHVLVIRRMHGPSFTPRNAIELYQMPDSQAGSQSFTTAAAFERVWTPECYTRSFHISDHYRSSYESDHPTRWNSNDPPPPVSIFMSSAAPNTMTHYHLWPSLTKSRIYGTAKTIDVWAYTLGESCTQQSLHRSDTDITRVIPGVYRSLAWHQPQEDRSITPKMTSLMRYTSREALPVAYASPTFPTDEPLLRKGRKGVPKFVYGPFQDVNEESYPNLFRRGVSAAAWDESIGRACFVSDESTVVDVLDMAYVVQPDDRLTLWNMNKKPQALSDGYSMAL